MYKKISNPVRNLFLNKANGLRNIIIISILSLIFTYFPMTPVQAEVNFSNIEVYEILNGGAKLKWSTNSNTKAEIWYGLDQNNLDRFMGYSVYDRWHETVLTGLEREKTYYYKIKAIEESGETTETFVRMFSTDDMEDTIKPKFKEGYPRIMQVTNNAVAFRWATDEKTKATIYYGTDLYNLSERVNYTKYKEWHDQYIYRLTPGEKYYFKFKAIDEDGNYKEKLINTTTHTSGTSNLNISNIKPLGLDSDLISARSITITWDTNLIAKGLVYYGTNPKKLNKRVYVSSGLKLKHEAVLDNLESNQTYYFEIKAYDSLYNKSKRTETFSFKTRKLSDDYKVGDLIKGSGPRVYVIKKNGEKAHIKNAEVFLGLGYKWSMIKNIDDSVLNEYITNGEISSTENHPEGTLIKYSNSPGVYLIENGKKRPFFTENAFIRRGYSWDNIIKVPNSEEYDTGDEIF